MGGRYKAARKQRGNARPGPSRFFLIALAIGVALLAWAAIYAILHPEKPAPPAATKTAIVYSIA